MSIIIKDDLYGVLLNSYLDEVKALIEKKNQIISFIHPICMEYEKLNRVVEFSVLLFIFALILSVVINLLIGLFNPLFDSIDKKFNFIVIKKKPLWKISLAAFQYKQTKL